MNALAEIKSRFSPVLSELADDPAALLSMIRPAGDPKFGDYQANCAMPMGKQMGKSPREIAADLVNKVSIDDFCQTVEIAGPGFINLTLDDEWIKQRLTAALTDERLAIEKVANPKTFIVDYSSPNVANMAEAGDQNSRRSIDVHVIPGKAIV